MVEPTWRKSRRSGNANGCVECAQVGGMFGVRDSKDREGPQLTFSRPAWVAFVAAVKAGYFTA